jgi:hypothetical protein
MVVCKSAADEDGDYEVWSSICRFVDDECRRRASPFKDWEEPSGVPLCLSSGLHRVKGFCLLEDKDVVPSIIFFYCCLDSWTVRCLQ